MKIPAIRAKMGDWTYYVSTLSFQQVNDHVSKIDEELHRSESLKELIQRSITNNYLSIKNYILNQPELFFNSLVLAVYDDYPDWKEVEIKYDDTETFQLGLLDFPGKHKIFPVDGQHRVEGIKAALSANPELAETKISAIFIGHKNDDEGMKRTRRLFSTLNRYAKPVTMDDIIALDEDDSIAIVTRNLLEGHALFTERKVTKSKNKAIPNDDKHSFTSIITLYDCNWEILKLFRKIIKQHEPNPERDNKPLEEYLKFRPSENDLEAFETMCGGIWSDLVKEFPYLLDFIKDKSVEPALKFRNNNDGGNLLFRPVGLLPFMLAAIEISKRKQLSFLQIFKQFAKLDFNLNTKPWKQVMWNDFEKTMIMGNQGLTKLLLIYLFDSTVLKPAELGALKNKYAASINFQGDNLDEVLDQIH
ncbi:DGQHR domain-containing protein [Ferruginibacter sp.]|nr:DGQHR domain-containing protein [Ferruginibacter sp.]